MVAQKGVRTLVPFVSEELWSRSLSGVITRLGYCFRAEFTNATRAGRDVRNANTTTANDSPSQADHRNGDLRVEVTVACP